MARSENCIQTDSNRGDQSDHGRTAKAPHGRKQSFSNAPGAARLREVADLR